MQGDTRGNPLLGLVVALGANPTSRDRVIDEYVKQDGQWKFKKMSLTPYFMVPLREGWAQEDRIKIGR